MAKKLSHYVKKHLSSKIRKIREDHPEFDHKKVLAVAISMLRERESGAGITRDVTRYERKEK
jgi:hypothetical protein